MQQDLPVKRKLDLSTDEVETGETGSLSLSEALTLQRLSTSWPPADLLRQVTTIRDKVAAASLWTGASPHAST